LSRKKQRISRVEQKINELISKMSIEEKVGQMAQFTLDVLGKGGGLYASDEPFELDPAMMDTVSVNISRIYLNTSNNRARTTEVWKTYHQYTAESN
jgi:beta-glucosidase